MYLLTWKSLYEVIALCACSVNSLTSLLTKSYDIVYIIKRFLANRASYFFIHFKILECLKINRMEIRLCPNISQNIYSNVKSHIYNIWSHIIASDCFHFFRPRVRLHATRYKVQLTSICRFDFAVHDQDHFLLHLTYHHHYYYLLRVIPALFPYLLTCILYCDAAPGSD